MVIFICSFYMHTASYMLCACKRFTHVSRGPLGDFYFDSALVVSASDDVCVVFCSCSDCSDALHPSLFLFPKPIDHNIIVIYPPISVFAHRWSHNGELFLQTFSSRRHRFDITLLICAVLFISHGNG